MNILLRSKIKQIYKTNSTSHPLFKYKNTIPLLALTGLGIYTYQRLIRRRTLIYKTPRLSLSKAFTSYFHTVLSSEVIQKDSIDLVSNVFNHSSTKKALSELIKAALEDKEILLNIKSFASSMVIDFIKDKAIKEQLLRNTILLLQNKDIKKESIELLKDFLEYNKTKEAFIGFCKEVSMKEEIKQMFATLVLESTINTMNMPETKKKGAEFIQDIWSDPIVRWNMFKKSILFWQGSNQSTITNGNAKH